MANADPFLLEPTEKNLRFVKGDPADVRLGDATTYIENRLSQADLEAMLKDANTVTLVGYPDDDGILANGGRIGARLGPSRVRHFLMRMTPPAFLKQQTAPSLVDLGNIQITTNQSIESRHIAARRVANLIFQTGARAMTIGGGHDYGFPDAAAFCDSVGSQGRKPVVINFDAHLDVRPLDRGITSGTPFFRLLQEFPKIGFHELGLQSQCNSKTHLEWLKARGGHTSFEEERHASGETLLQVLERQLGTLAFDRPPTFISVDIDAFSSAIAPGASQSWPTGFQAAEFFNCLSWCMRHLDVRGLGVYEVSPALDVDDRTARLAALIAHRFVFQY